MTLCSLESRDVRGGARRARRSLCGALRRSPEELAAEQKAVIVAQYCTECHSAAERKPSSSLENVDLLHRPRTPAVWEKVIHKLDVGLMPPPGEPRPDAKTVAGLVGYLETALDSAAAANPKSGPPAAAPTESRRVRQRDPRPARLQRSTSSRCLPADSSSHGFDNVSDVLKTSPLLLERYLTVGMRVAATAVGDTTMEPRAAHYEPAPICRRTAGSKGLPLGTRGGLVVEHYFPIDGGIRVPARAVGSGREHRARPGRFPDAVRVRDAARRGARASRATSAASTTTRCRIATKAARPPRPKSASACEWPVTAGVHRLGFTFVMKSFAIEQRVLQPFKSDLPPATTRTVGRASSRVLITGPYDSKAAGDTPVRRAIFTCRPGAPAGSSSVDHVDCAEQILGRLARAPMAARRPKRISRPCSSFYEQGSDGGRDFERGIQLALARILSGPEFLFRGTEPARRLGHRGRSTASMTRRSRRGSRCSFGAASRTTSCSTWRSRAGSRDPQCSRRKCGACSRTRVRTRSSRISRSSGCSCATSPPRRPICSSSRTGTTTCARTCCARPICSSRACCSTTRASSISSAPTTRSSTSGSRRTTASTACSATRFAA